MTGNCCQRALNALLPSVIASVSPSSDSSARVLQDPLVSWSSISFSFLQFPRSFSYTSLLLQQKLLQSIFTEHVMWKDASVKIHKSTLLNITAASFFKKMENLHRDKELFSNVMPTNDLGVIEHVVLKQ